MMSFRFSGMTFVMALAVLAGCSLAPDMAAPVLDVPDIYKEDKPPAKTAQWAEAVDMAAADRGAWWKVFADPQLDALMAEALQDNLSLQAAAQRVEQARAFARSKALGVLPDISLSANAARRGSAATGAYNDFSAGGFASYEADLFNRIRDEEAALKQEAQAAQSVYNSALLALQADVAQTYFALRTLDAERALLLDTVKVRAEAARIMRRKFSEGLVGGQDDGRAQTDVESARADLTALERRRAETEHAMAVLLGKMPSGYKFAHRRALEKQPPKIPAGLPSTLLQRRPDMAEAFARMSAANARIGVARAAFFPSITLTAAGGFESAALHSLFEWSSRTWALGQVGALLATLPVFDNGRRSAQLDLARAQYAESVALYRQQALVAFKDVEDALSAQRLLARQDIEQGRAARAARETTRLTQARHTAGDTDYFEVVEAQRASLAAERAAIQVRGQRFAATVALIRALGGDWRQEG